MYRSKLTKTVVFMLLIAGVLQAGIMAYSAVANQTIRKYEESAAYVSAQNADASDTTVQEVKIPKKEIDISNVILNKEVEDMITSLDMVNAARNINNYKIMLAALDVPVSFQKEVESIYGKGYKVQDVLTAYEFLYQNYGNIYELEELIAQKESGKAWNTIFKEYKKNKEKFEPRNFEDGKLDEVFGMPGITPDDIVIADRIAQQTGLEFDELIALRGKGMDWKAINEDLEIVNTSDELPRVAVTSVQVKKHMTDTGLSEEQVIEALVLAQKLDKDGKVVIDKIKAGKAEEDIIAECLEEKYQ